MAFSTQADGLVFDRNGPGKRTVVEGNSEATRTAEKLCFAETSPGVPIITPSTAKHGINHLGAELPCSLKFLL